MTLQDLINTISEDPSQVREALELIKRQSRRGWTIGRRSGS